MGLTEPVLRVKGPLKYPQPLQSATEEQRRAFLFSDSENLGSVLIILHFKEPGKNKNRTVGKKEKKECMKKIVNNKPY